MLGQTISHYTIIEHLGGGGMGVVYKAHDTRLDRFVALKFLPPDLSREPDSNRRFRQEARAASALDHPNICTIYDIEETDDGQLFIAMAYYDGATLKKRIAEGPLPLLDALTVAIQTSDGLAKAHEAGIVHRDIKPANLMITKDGLVKIVDFGVAKLTGASRMTQEGARVGTMLYMSPEQIRGQEADSRSDLWSLGVTLYEMVTGQLPFKGEPATVVQAIQSQIPQPLTALRSGVPIEVDRILDRILAKRAADRYQTALDMRSELARVQREITTADDTPTITMGPSSDTIAPEQRHWPFISVIAVLALVVVLTIGIVWQFEPVGPRLMTPNQITAATGVEDYPTWSPEGKRLAYHSNQSGNWDIWITRVGGGQSVNLTADHAGEDMNPSRSPDGDQIAFWSRRHGAGVYMMPAVGGTARKVLAIPDWLPGEIQVQWSPDGKEFACVVGDTTLIMFSPQDRVSRRLSLPGQKGNRRLQPRWSPDGRYLAYVDATALDSQVSKIWILRLEDNEAIRVTDGLSEDWSPDWSADGRSLFFVSNRGGAMDLWDQPLDQNARPDGAPRAVTTGVVMRTAVFSPDRTKLAYSRGRLAGNLWRVPILSDRPATWTDAERILHNPPSAPGIRKHDCQYVVHSTNRLNWSFIRRDMILKSPSTLRACGRQCDPVGHRFLGDPEDFLDYIHFAPYQSVHTEFVVLSAQMGRIVCSETTYYMPGVRLYLDNHAMIRAGLVVRDGLHHSKVKDSLNLNRFMILAVEGYKVKERWTPRGFCDYATELFERHVGKDAT